MALELGTNVLVQVSDGGSPTSFVSVVGQRTGRINLAPETDDTTSKLHSGWRSQLQVLLGAEVTFTGKVDWADTTGFDVIRNAVTTRATLECKFILNAAGAHYRGEAIVSAFDVGGDFNTVTDYNITLSAAGPWTYAAS